MKSEDQFRMMVDAAAMGASADGALYREALRDGGPEVLRSLADAYLAGYDECVSGGNPDRSYPTAAEEFAYQSGYNDGEPEAPE
jgi:hypothetical protein